MTKIYCDDTICKHNLKRVCIKKKIHIKTYDTSSCMNLETKETMKHYFERTKKNSKDK